MEFLKNWKELEGDWYYYYNKYGDIYSMKLGMIVKKHIDKNGDVYAILYKNNGMKICLYTKDLIN